jgi:hypothetical protein
MDTLDRIESMRSQGQSLTLRWGEDTDAWEVSWITSGERFTSVSRNLRLALDGAYNAAVSALSPGATR